MTTERPFTYLQLRIPNEMHAELMRESERDRRTIHAEALTAIEEWLKARKHGDAP